MPSDGYDGSVPRTVLFANPTAQSGKAKEWIEEARALLGLEGIEHELIATEPHGRTVGLVRDAIDQGGARRVIYMGGDGTFAEVAKGILGSKHAAEVDMGMLPTGTANDQGKSFGLQAGVGALGRNVAVIARGAITKIDVGYIQRLDEADQVTDTDLFFDSASVGLSAATLLTRNRDREAVASVPLLRHVYRDHLVYAGALFKRLAEAALPYPRFDLEVVVDGETHYYESVIDVIIKNTHIYGGEWILAPDGSADDGKLDMLPIAGVRDFTSKMISTLRHLPISEADLEKLGLEHSKPVSGAHFELTVLEPGAGEPPPCQIDGEEFVSGERFRVEALHRVLRLIVPP